MREKSLVILLTGEPGIGKTTVVQKVIRLLGDRAGGFYTREVREGGFRVGFELVTLDGEVSWLATKKQETHFVHAVRFGAYRVNLDALELVAVPAIARAMAERDVVVVDEIGPMELFSEAFYTTILQLIAREVAVFGTIVRRSHPLADAIKADRRVTLRQVTIQNREHLPLAIYNELLQRSR